MITLSMKSDDLQKLVTDARAARRALDDRRTPLQKIKRYQNKRWMTNFDGAGRIYGRWQRHSKWTAPGKLLNKTGSMRGEFIADNEAGQITRTAIHWKMNSKPAVWHDAGSANKPWKTENPARLLWDINDADRAEARRTLEAWVDDIIDRYFGE